MLITPTPKIPRTQIVLIPPISKSPHGAKCANTPNLNTTYKQVASRADKRQDLGSQKIRKNQENSKIKILSILAKKVLLPQCTIPQEK